jgi:hypothetical protein
MTGMIAAVLRRVKLARRPFQAYPDAVEIHCSMEIAFAR